MEFKPEVWSAGRIQATQLNLNFRSFFKSIALPHAIFGTYLTKKKLFTRNSDLTGSPVFLSAKSGSPTMEVVVVSHPLNEESSFGVSCPFSGFLNS